MVDFGKLREAEISEERVGTKNIIDKNGGNDDKNDEFKDKKDKISEKTYTVENDKPSKNSVKTHKNSAEREKIDKNNKYSTKNETFVAKNAALKEKEIIKTKQLPSVHKIPPEKNTIKVLIPKINFWSEGSNPPMRSPFPYKRKGSVSDFSNTEPVAPLAPPMVQLNALIWRERNFFNNAPQMINTYANRQTVQIHS